MQLFRVTIIIISSLVFDSAWAAAADDSIPGGRMAISSKSPLKPLLNNHDGIKSEERRESVLRGLLQTRQYVCPYGYGQYTCCGPHQRCCEVGCCDLSDYCATDTSTGQRGCCPLGETCSGTSDTCDDSGYFPCPNDDYCCPFGSTCFRDSSSSRRCRASGSNPAPTTRRTTTFRDTSTISSFTTRAASTTVSSTTFSAITTGTINLSPTTYSIPLPSSGAQTVVVGATDSRIFWHSVTGTSWILGPSSCNSTAQSKKISGLGTFSIQGASGTTVYIALSAHNVEYDINVNGHTTSYKEHLTTDCKLMWSSGVLTNKTDIIITVIGPAFLKGLIERRRAFDEWSFEFHNFLITMPDSMTSAAMYAKARSTFNAGLILASVAFLGVFL